VVGKVRRAMENGKTYLLGKQRLNDGSWEVSVSHPGGETSLAILALLTAGVPPKNDAIQKGLKYLRGIEPGQTYVVALHTMAFAQAGAAIDRGRIQRNGEWLIKAQKDYGWSYTQNGPPDNSNTQYAVLGLHAGIEAGVEVDRKSLMRLRKYMLESQVNGGWPYRDGQAPRMTMSCAG